MTQDMMRKIRAILAKAESTSMPEEARTFREHAARLMRKYQIEEAQLIASGRQSSGDVVDRLIPFGASVGRKSKIAMANTLANLHHCRAFDRRVVRPSKTQQGQSGGVRVVGGEQDVRLVALMWASLCIQLESEVQAYLRSKRESGAHGRSLRLAFTIGWTNRVRERLVELYSSTPEGDEGKGTAMVWVGKDAAVELYVKQNIAVRDMPDAYFKVNLTAYDAGGHFAEQAHIGQTSLPPEKT